MKQSSKSSASVGGNGDFDDELLQSGHHNNSYSNCNIHHHHHHYHFHNEASGDEEQNPPLKQADPVKATASNTDEEQNPTETTTPPTQALPINDSPPTKKPYVRIQNVANPNYFLSVRDGKVILALFALGDESQHWYQNLVNHPDSIGSHCCCLVNKATGEAIKDPDRDNCPADLITYDPRALDGSILWETPEQCGFGDLVNHTRIMPFDHPQYTLGVNFTSRGTSHGGSIVYVNKIRFCKDDNSNVWNIIDYQKPAKLVMLDD